MLRRKHSMPTFGSASQNVAMSRIISLHERLKARLSLVRADLDEVLVRLSEDDMPFAPRQGMRTIAGQLAEIAATETQVMAWLQGGRKIPWEEANASFENGATLA